MRVGILGGTFDPVHLGHLRVAEEVREALDLQRVLFIPAAEPPHKPGHRLAPDQDRLQMVRLAIRGNPFFTVSDMELKRTGPSYSVDTLRTLREQHPEWELFFILGLDAFAEISTWKDYLELFELAEFVVVSRPRFERGFLRSCLPVAARPYFRYSVDRMGLRHRSGHNVRFLQVTGFDISATDIRARLADGRSIRYLVPQVVERYIAEHGLYGQKDAR